MTCREASEFLQDYLSAELEPGVSTEFEAHLTDCPNCHLFLVQYRSTIAAGRMAFPETDDDMSTVLPDDVVRAILAAIAKERT
jgi:anti-sigma factor RsiW